MEALIFISSFALYFVKRAWNRHKLAQEKRHAELAKLIEEIKDDTATIRHKVIWPEGEPRR